MFQQRSAAALTEPPPAFCNPSPTPFPRLFPFPFQIVQKPKLTLMLLESDTDFRQIFMDGRKLPDDPQPSWLGYSVGKWQGDSLVVDTVGLIRYSPLDIFGHPHREAMHVTERFQRRDFGHMDIQVTIDDSEDVHQAVHLQNQPDGCFLTTDFTGRVLRRDEKDAAHVAKK